MTQDAVAIAETVVKLAASGLFDPAWYRLTYPDVVTDGSDPLVHYCNSGWRRGLKPNLLFDSGFYLARYNDVRKAGINPLLHYFQYGEAELRQPSPDFDPGWYRQAYDVPAPANCLADYLQRRHHGPTSPTPGFDVATFARQHPEAAARHDDLFQLYKSLSPTEAPGMAVVDVIRASGVFDPEYYRRHYPEVAARGLDPVEHYCGTGWQEGCSPNAVFDTAWYLAMNEDVRSHGINPLYHYIAFGEAENRRPSADFDPATYRTAHQLEAGASCLADDLARSMLVPKPEVSPSLADSPNAPIAGPMQVLPQPPAPVQTTPDELLIQHSDLFDINFYLINYPDVRASGLDPLQHFCRYGWQEGRRANPYFDAGWYSKTYLSATEQNPLAHYVKVGEAVGNRPIVYFDPVWYRTEYGVQQPASPLLHFLENRRRQRVSPLKLFDVQRYMGLYGAEIGPNRDPFAHYLRVGIYQDIEPSADFDAKNYRMTQMEGRPARARPVSGAEIHEKLRREPLNPLVHFLLRNFAAVPQPAARRAEG